MSQHTYTLKFSISIDNPPAGVFRIHGETKEIKPELLNQVMNDAGDTKEDVLKLKIEEKIRGVIPCSQGVVNVVFDSLEEV